MYQITTAVLAAALAFVLGAASASHCPAVARFAGAPCCKCCECCKECPCGCECECARKGEKCRPGCKCVR